MRDPSINAQMRELGPEGRQPFLDAEKEAGKAIGHIGFASSDGRSDRHNCSCGWNSPTYDDGDGWAYLDWVDHITAEGAQVKYPVRS